MEEDFPAFALEMCLPSKRPRSSTVVGSVLGHQNKPTPRNLHHLAPTPVTVARSQEKA